MDRRSEWSATAGYLAAVAATAGMVLLRWLIDPVVKNSLPLATLYGAVAFAVWYGGYRPALLALILGYLACDYLFMEPRYAIGTHDGRDVIALALYLLSGLIIIIFGEALRVAWRQAEASRREALDRQVQLEDEVARRRSAEDRARAAAADAEARAREAIEARGILQTIFDHTPEGIILVGGPPDYPILANSRYGQEFLRMPRETGIPAGQHAESYGILLPDGTTRPRPEELPLYRASRHGERVRNAEFLIEQPDGGRMAVLVDAVPIHGVNGEIVGAVSGWRDVTELKKAVQALKDADRHKDEFLAMLAHELRSPLAPIRNALEILRRAGNDSRMIGRSRDVLERQVAHLVRLVDDLLDVARIARGKLELRKQRVNLVSIIAAVVEAGRPLVEEMGQQLNVTLPPEPVYLDADPARLTQVVLNLLTNAAKYTERGGHIGITAERQGSDAVITVRDSGIGIPADRLPHIFDLFMQVEGSRGRSRGGLGLGLTLVKRLTELHGGTVGVRSDGPGRGSEFTVRLPAVLGRAAAESPPCEPAAAASGRRILVVDDHLDVADTLAEMLRLMGNEVETAHDGLEALRVAEAFRPDIALIDIGLPRLDGHEVARRIRGEPWGERMVLIAMTGWHHDDDKQRSREAGFNFHLLKPVDPQGLTQLLAGLLTRTVEEPA